MMKLHVQFKVGMRQT